MILVALGANLESVAGPPQATIRAALDALEAEGVRIVSRSQFYRSAPVPLSAQPDFVNAVASVAAALDPRTLLTLLQAIEARFGRVRGERNAARTLDLDLLAYDGVISDTPDLVLPHPRLHERAFVLLPLMELAPAWRHPRLGRTVRELVSALPPDQDATPLSVP